MSKSIAGVCVSIGLLLAGCETLDQSRPSEKVNVIVGIDSLAIEYSEAAMSHAQAHFMRTELCAKQGEPMEAETDTINVTDQGGDRFKQTIACDLPYT